MLACVCEDRIDYRIGTVDVVFRVAMFDLFQIDQSYVHRV